MCQGWGGFYAEIFRLFYEMRDKKREQNFEMDYFMGVKLISLKV